MFSVIDLKKKTNMSIIGKKISDIRKTKGISQEELAELSKVNLRTIQRIENNENVPRGKTLNLICNALDLNLEEIQTKKNVFSKNKYGELIISGLFLIILNFILMGIFGYLTFDSEANMNSRFGGLLLSFFIPIFIVSNTPKMAGAERLLKFGTGFIFYIILVLANHGFPVGFVTGLFICLIISLSILFYGKKLIPFQE